MIFGSVCSGIEAASAAWGPLGWKADFFSEIEKFPCAVLGHHYPDVPNLGDMTKFKEWPDYAIDVLVGGTPCQSFSVAGLRKGLDDPRGNLMLTFGAIAGRYRPKWLVWENVPGVLSSEGGTDFGSFLGLVSGRHIACPPTGWANSGIVPGYKNAYGLAWRVLDAQYAGVPQRRRRVFVVGYLGDWRRAAAVLFERHSLQGYTPPSRKTGERVAPTISARTKGGGGLGTDFDCDGGLQVYDMRGNGDGKAVNCITGDHASRPTDYTPIVRVRTAQTHANGHGISEDVAHTLDGANGQCVAFQPKASRTQSMNPSETCPTLGTTKEPAVAFAQNTRDEVRELGNNVAGELAGQPGMKQQTYLRLGTMVRRLTPRECERLQGFNDDYTRIPGRSSWRALDDTETPEMMHAMGFLVKKNKNGKWRVNDPDGPRYKALGNSMAVPVMRWIGERIQMVEDLCR
jgi:DNA (cytosine-5)-methyltransferase 1